MAVAESPSTGISLKTFTLAYLLCLALIIGVTTLLQFEVPSAMGIIAIMAAASAPVHTFVAQNGREPTKAERRRFAIGGTAISILISLGLTAVIAYAAYGMTLLEKIVAEIKPMWTEYPWLVAALPLITLLVPWLVLYFGSGFMGRQAAKALSKTA